MRERNGNKKYSGNTSLPVTGGREKVLVVEDDEEET